MPMAGRATEQKWPANNLAKLNSINKRLTSTYNSKLITLEKGNNESYSSIVVVGDEMPMTDIADDLTH